MLETINLDDGLTTAGQSLAPFGSLFDQSGILRPNAFTVSALGSPGMFVEVSGSDEDDVAVIKTDDGGAYFIRNTMDLPVPITANSSGVTKTDAIVLFTDLSDGDDENAGSPGASQAIAVRRAGVSTGLPSDGEIDAATGNNPWIFLKQVTVTHGTGEIESEDLGGSADEALLRTHLLGTNRVPLTSLAKDALGSWAQTISISGGTFSIGNGTIVGRYSRIGNRVRAFFQVTWGSTTSASNNNAFTFAFPVAPSAIYTKRTVLGSGVVIDDSTGVIYKCEVLLINSTTLVLALFNNSPNPSQLNTYVQGNTLTWASADIFNAEFEYLIDP